VAGVGIGVWAAALLVLGLSSWRQTAGAVGDIRRIRSQLASSTDTADLGRLADELAASAERLSKANDRLHGPWWAPVGTAPFVSTQLDSARNLTHAGERTAATVGRVLDEAAGLRSGEGMARSLEELGRLARTATRDLSGVRLGPTSGVLPPLRTARATFARELKDARHGAARLEVVGAELASFVTGPRRYVLIPAANAEMRAGVGAFLRAAPLVVRDGRVELGPVTSPDNVRPPIPAGAVELRDADLRRIWSWLNGNRTISTLGTSPRFPASAEVAADVYEYLIEQPIDGVLAIDVGSLQGLLRVTGPITIDGRRFDFENVVVEMNRRQYERTDEPRLDDQAKLAAAALDRLLSGRFNAIEVARSLAGVARGRHLLAWSRDKGEMAGWRALGLTGELSERSVFVSLINIGNTKLDPSLQVAGELFAAPSAKGYDVSVRLDVRNQATGREAPNVAGAAPFGNPSGTYFGMLTVNVPAAATDVTLDGRGRIAAIGPDGPTKVMGTWVELPPGQKSSTTIRFALPSSALPLRIEPSARMPGIAWRAGPRSWIDASSETLDLAALPPPGPRPAITWTADRPGFERKLADVRTALGPLADVDVDGFAALAVLPQFRFSPGAIAGRLPASPLRGARITALMQLLVERRLIGNTAPAYGVTVPPTSPLVLPRS
jgi:hypothetical protein